MRQQTRRTFLSVAAASAVACSRNQHRPNILWITSEDNGPHLGCYGDAYASTPNLDRLASRGLIYWNAWSNAPVCAPARTTIISGMYPPATGSEHMRSETRLPANMHMYPYYLREAGYYCSNNVKEDYNLEKVGQVWNDSSGKAHWRNRGAEQPFFSIFNFTTTHESQVRKRPHTPVHDPAKVRVPAYHPDTPEVRRDWAQYYDKLTEMDGQAGQVLRDLEADGLAEDTIVFYYGDHGAGMPRSKRWPYNSGLRVPIIAHIPEKYRHLAPPEYRAGGRSERMVGFVDLAPTVLSLAGVQPPAHMHGHAFMGEHIGPEQQYLYGFRGRMDERYDLVRSVRDKRFVYIRNYMPHKIYGQYIDYMFQTPTTQVWKKLYDQGKLEPPKTHFWETKPAEELYDLETDPDETRNLAAEPEHKDTLERLKAAQQELAMQIRDVGFLPEAEIHSRSKGSTPYEMGHDDQRYPLKKVLVAADRASSLKPDLNPEFRRGLEDPDSAVRYWSAMGLLMRGADAVRDSREALEKALADEAPTVRVVAAEALGRYGDSAALQKALPVLTDLASIDKHGVYVSLLALNAIDALGKKARPVRNAVEALPLKDANAPARANGYVPRLVESITANLG